MNSTSEDVSVVLNVMRRATRPVTATEISQFINMPNVDRKTVNSALYKLSYSKHVVKVDGRPPSWIPGPNISNPYVPSASAQRNQLDQNVQRLPHTQTVFQDQQSIPQTSLTQQVPQYDSATVLQQLPSPYGNMKLPSLTPPSVSPLGTPTQLYQVNNFEGENDERNQLIRYLSERISNMTLDQLKLINNFISS